MASSFGAFSAFGNVHEHRGLGLRALAHGFYECRQGLKRRLIFEYSAGVLYFHTIGDHDDVRRFLKPHR